MRFISLQSGSAGNCFLIQSHGTNILIDVGIDKKQIVERLNKCGVSIENIDAILITHEHIDHIKAIKYVPIEKVFATKETLFLMNGFNEIMPYKCFNVGNFTIVPISISHDIRNGLGYLLHDGEESLLYLTDTGCVLKQNLDFMKDCNHYIIEANYNKEMLMQSKRPSFLKTRINSRKGHLSNTQCGDVLAKVIGPHTETILLAHVSQDCNTHDLCYKEVTDIIKDKGIDISSIEISIAKRYEMTFGRKEFEQKLLYSVDIDDTV